MAEVKKIESNEEFQEFAKNANSLNIIKISAPWCGPCRALAEIIKGLTQEEVEGVLIGEVDADDEWFEDKAVELKIRGIPVLLAYKDGELKDRVQGAMMKEALIDFFERNR